MPRGRCHFALLHTLHERLRAERPEVAALAERHLPDFLAGNSAPDGLRFVGRMGKFATHFYTEDRRETWGQAVAGMFRAHPDLAHPERLRDRDRVVVLGYIAHLTVDEAFRDEVTRHVHGTENWRPVILGLWSMVDELPVGYSDVAAQIDRFSRSDRVGFIACDLVRKYLALIRPWADQADAWEIEKVFLELIDSRQPLAEARRAWEANRARAAPFLDDERLEAFVARAVRLGAEEIGRYLDGAYVQARFGG